MQTKRKVLARNTARERSSSRESRSQKKVLENVEVLGVNSPKRIRSSARKRSFLKLSAKRFPRIRDIPSSEDLDSNFLLAQNAMTDIFLGGNAVDATDGELKENKGGIDHHVVDTGFSPTFNIPKYVAKETTVGVDFAKSFGCEDEKYWKSRRTLKLQIDSLHKDLELGNVDEASEATMSVEVSLGADSNEEIHDFDSLLFIKNLPDLSLVVPNFRPMLLPIQTRSCPATTLVLDLDETLVHSKLGPISDADFTFPLKFGLEEYTVYVRCRPHLKEFLERIASLFEVVVFTASHRMYAEKLLNILDPRREILRHRAYRGSCVFVGGSYLKDLSILGRDLARLIIVDNSLEAFGFQVNNGIPIESWYGDPSDQELLLLLPFLEILARVEDVRPLIVKKYNIQEKIAAAVILHSTLSRENPW